MLDIEKIRQLIDMMVANDLAEISLRDGDVEVKLRRPKPASESGGSSSQSASPTESSTVAQGTNGAAGEASNGPAGEGEETAELVEIKSPMVGTLYVAADPHSAPFAHVGTHVLPDTVVCIVEAMKVFNEIKAELTGTIERVLVKNEQPVEFGQPLFLVRPT